jgi:hypothetical protein
MDAYGNDYLKQVDSLLASGSQSWLFGAGISLNANIPLMRPLTTRVFEMAEGKPEKELLVARYCDFSMRDVAGPATHERGGPATCCSFLAGRISRHDESVAYARTTRGAVCR